MASTSILRNTYHVPPPASTPTDNPRPGLAEEAAQFFAKRAQAAVKRQGMTQLVEESARSLARCEVSTTEAGTTNDAPATLAKAARFAANRAESTSEPVPAAVPHAAPAVLPARRLLLPTRYMELEPVPPLSVINDDPVFHTKDAAIILGMSLDALKKRRQRGQEPDYISYGDQGPVRYALSALNAFKAAHTVITRKKGRK